MEPTIGVGDYVMASRLHCFFTEPVAGDIVVIAPHPDISLHPWIHRVLGVASDDLTALSSPRPTKSRRDVYDAPGKDAALLTLVPAGHVYQSGDATKAYHGLVPVRMIRARVIFHCKIPWAKRPDFRPLPPPSAPLREPTVKPLIATTGKPSFSADFDPI